jgi:tetratricopeptide (TPR) repeat protein
MKQLTIILLAFCVATTAHSQCVECNESSYRAYLASDIKMMKSLWKEVVNSQQQTYAADKTDENALRLAVAQFGLLSATMRDKDEDLFDEYVDATEEHLEKLLKKNKKWSEASAILSGVYGLKMGYSPMKGMFLGSKSSSMIAKAKEQSPESALVWKVYANSKLFTPESFGGDIKEAIRAYEKSINLYETSGSTRFNWLYLDALAFLGQAYLKDGQSAKAIATYEKALVAEPDFHWIKNNLLPAARKSASR